MRNHEQLTLLLAEHGGLVRRADHPGIASSLDWWLRSGQLVRVLPGVLAGAAVADDAGVRARALTLWRPDAVLVGAPAVRLQYWLEHPDRRWTFSAPRVQRPPAGWQRVPAPVPPEWILQHNDIRIAHPAWNAVWLAGQDEGLAIDEGLRRRMFTTAHCEAALATMDGRHGQLARRFVVGHSRENPWSPAERRLHVMLRRNGITGWTGNLRVAAPDGGSYFLDVAFEKERLFLEVQSWLHHGSKEQFHRDNEKFAWLAGCGWRGIPVDWPLMEREQQLMQWVRQLLADSQSPAPARARRFKGWAGQP